jgi:hypothetical protein
LQGNPEKVLLLTRWLGISNALMEQNQEKGWKLRRGCMHDLKRRAFAMKADYLPTPIK